MADEPNLLQRFMSQRQEPWEFEGVEPATRAYEAHRKPSWFSPPNAFSAFTLGLGEAFPLTRLGFIDHIRHADDPENQQARHDMTWTRMQNPGAHNAGLNLGLIPTAAFPRSSVPWAAYVFGTDPATQKAMREARDRRMAPGTAMDAGWGLRHRGSGQR